MNTRTNTNLIISGSWNRTRTVLENYVCTKYVYIFFVKYYFIAGCIIDKIAYKTSV